MRLETLLELASMMPHRGGLGQLPPGMWQLQRSWQISWWLGVLSQHNLRVNLPSLTLLLEAWPPLPFSVVMSDKVHL